MLAHTTTGKHGVKPLFGGWSIGRKLNQNYTAPGARAEFGERGGGDGESEAGEQSTKSHNGLFVRNAKLD